MSISIAPNVLQLRLTALELVRFKPLSVDAVIFSCEYTVNK